MNLGVRNEHLTKLLATSWLVMPNVTLSRASPPAMISMTTQGCRAGGGFSLMANGMNVPSRELQHFELMARVTTPSPRMLPDEWARLNRRYGPEKGRPGPRDPSL